MNIEASNVTLSAPAKNQFAGIDELRAWLGREVGVSEWLEVSQRMIDQFAEATDDSQWIHVDPSRGRTVAHGFLIASLLATLFESTVIIGGTSSAINYGFNRLRFTAPVFSGSFIRGRFVLDEYEAIKGGAQFTWSVTVERQGEEKPAMVAAWLMRRYA